MSKRRLGFSLILFLVAALSCCATLVGAALSGWSPPPTSVPLTSGLPREVKEANTAFNQRVQARFPIGMSVADLGKELRIERFVREDWSDQPGSEHWAERYEGAWARQSFTFQARNCRLGLIDSRTK